MGKLLFILYCINVIIDHPFPFQFLNFSKQYKCCVFQTIALLLFLCLTTKCNSNSIECVVNRNVSMLTHGCAPFTNANKLVFIAGHSHKAISIIAGQGLIVQGVPSMHCWIVLFGGYHRMDVYEC